MLWLPYPQQAAGSALALEARRFARRSFRNRRSLAIEPFADSLDPISVFEAMADTMSRFEPRL